MRKSHHLENELAGRARELRKRIERWRRTRPRFSPMPDALWKRAAMLARNYGVCPVARALRIDYKALAMRARAAEATRIDAKHEPSPETFVELMPSPFAAPRSGTVLELSDPSGAKLVIRIELGGHVDVIGLVNAFRHAAR